MITDLTAYNSEISLLTSKSDAVHSSYQTAYGFEAWLKNGSSLYAECHQSEQCSYWTIHANDTESEFPNTLNSIYISTYADNVLYDSRFYCDTPHRVDEDYDSSENTACNFDCYSYSIGYWIEVYAENGFDDIDLDFWSDYHTADSSEETSTDSYGSSYYCYADVVVYCDANHDGKYNTSTNSQWDDDLQRDIYYSDEYCDVQWYDKYSGYYCDTRDKCSNEWKTTMEPTVQPTLSPTQQEQWEFSFGTCVFVYVCTCVLRVTSGVFAYCIVCI